MIDTSNEPSLFSVPQQASIERLDDAQFQHEVSQLIEEGEKLRLACMRKHQLNKMIAATVGLTLLVAGIAGFCWFLLMNTDISKAFTSLIIGLVVPVLLYGWMERPLKHYLNDYKSSYLPKLAALIGGFSYNPTRGINEKVLKRTGVVPSFEYYESEDCFRGRYKGTKVLFSEARLKDKRKNILFDGIFVLLETPHAVFEGHTIITADRKLANDYATTRWKKLHPLELDNTDPNSARFVTYSDKPESNSLLLGKQFLKELAEVDMAFDDAGLSAVLFNGKYVFLMIPHEENMFEACSLHVPISTNKRALQCKKEIEQILEMVDVFDLYASKS